MKKTTFAVVTILAVVILAITFAVLNDHALDLEHPNYASDYAEYMKSTPEVYVDASGKTWQYDDERGPLYQMTQNEMEVDRRADIAAITIWEDGSWENARTGENGCIPGYLCDDSVQSSFDKQMSAFAQEEIGKQCKRLIEYGDEKAGAQIVDWAIAHSVGGDPCALVK